MVESLGGMIILAWRKMPALYEKNHIPFEAR
jgi:hypothetical protein